MFSLFFFFNDTATTEIYTLSLHDALPIWDPAVLEGEVRGRARPQTQFRLRLDVGDLEPRGILRDEEEGDPFVALRPRVPGVDLDEIGDAAVRDEPLLSVQDPFISLM